MKWGRGAGIHSEFTPEGPEARVVTYLPESTWGVTGRARFLPDIDALSTLFASGPCPHWGKGPGVLRAEVTASCPPDDL